LPGAIAGLGPDVNTTLIDTFELTEVAYGEPAFFGAQQRGPCSSDPSLACEDATYWDPFHPTALVHDFVADEVRAAYVAPVPSACGGLDVAGGLWRSRCSASPSKAQASERCKQHREMAATPSLF
jgi:phospholipase/lecithinase/hemolysin